MASSVTRYLVFDTETTGLPPRNSIYKKYHEPSQFHYYDKCRIVELAMTSCMYNKTENTHFDIANYSNIVHPEDFVIENDSIHHISNTLAEAYGTSVQDVLDMFMNEVKKVDILVAHNIDFDIHVVLAELYRQNRTSDVNIMYQKKWYCTMLHGMAFMETQRWPKLINLYQYVSPNSKIAQIEQTHRAMDDVWICKQCFQRIYTES